MGGYIVLAGPTLDQALALVRFGLITATPSDIQRLDRPDCSGSIRRLAEIRRHAPSEIKRLLTATNTSPVHLLVASESDCHECSVAYHICKASLPVGSFMWLCEGVLIPTWPLYFVLKCRDEPSLSARLMVGMELCGSYGHLVIGDRTTDAFYRQPKRDAEGKLVAKWNYPKIKPAINCTALQNYMGQLSSMKGLARANEALRYMLDGSASPTESAFALMATMPCRLGGYGFAGMELNPEIKVPDDKRHLTRFDVYHPDGYLRALETDLEYESDENHSGPRAVSRDKARRNDIQALGIEVKDVTWEMLSHVGSLDLLFEQLLEKEHVMGFDPRRRHRQAVRDPYNRAKRIVRLDELLFLPSFEG